jgi:hypothetical protein
MTRPLSLLLALLACGSLFAQTAPPTPQEFLGYPIGSRFTPHHRIVDYLDELDRVSPLLVHERFGQTWEGRPLSYVVITSAANHAQLDAIRQRMGEINRVDLTAPARAEEIARTAPVVVWLGFGVHGSESSSAEAAMEVARKLLDNDADTASLLQNCVVIIDPLMNPDGRERYIQWFQRAVGSQLNAGPSAFEHYEPWPGGRYNHYLNDMNRDWSWGTQQETRARLQAYQRWNPQVFVDFHEMSFESSYFFPPGAAPVNRNIDAETLRWLQAFGSANAEAFSQRGWPFFVAETFDLFYPGYGDSWPSLRGAIGMTYEMAGGGRAGAAVRREDESVLTLPDRIERHFTAAMVTLRTAARNRSDLILHNYRALKNQYERPAATYLVLPTSQNFERFVELMTRQGVLVQSLTTPARIRVTPAAGGPAEVRGFPAATAVVTTRQPYGALVRTLMEKSPVIDEQFLAEQREKIDADEQDDFYDVTAWSLPVAQNLDAFLAVEPVAAESLGQRARRSFQPGKFGYIIDARDSEVYRAIGRLLRAGVRFRVSSADLVHGGRSFARGSVVIHRTGNTATLDEVLRRIVAEINVSVHPVDSAWSGGLALGSSRIEFIRDPKIAVAAGEGTDPTSVGMIWYLLDIETEIPHTLIPIHRFGTIDLAEFRVIVLPDGTGYLNQLGRRGIEKLQAWARGGGTLVAIKGAADFLRQKDVEISQLKPWTPPKEKDEEKDEQPPAEERYTDYRIPGAAFRTVLNQRSYLTFGLSKAPSVLLEGATAILPAAKKVDNIVTVTERDPLVSGFAWPESLERIKGSAYLVSERYGSGEVITFAGEPYYRLFWRGTLPLFLNAVLYAPSFDR